MLYEPKLSDLCGAGDRGRAIINSKKFSERASMTFHHQAIEKCKRIFFYFQKVMLGTPHKIVPSCSEEDVVEMNQAHELIFEMLNAIEARKMYESSDLISSEDYFFLGSKLKKLIRQAQAEVDLCTEYWPDSEVTCALSSRLEQVKGFYRFVIEKLKNGF